MSVAAAAELPTQGEEETNTKRQEQETGTIVPVQREKGGKKGSSLTISEVSKRTTIAAKRKIWDTNDASIDAAQTAVDQWENAYNGFKGLLIAGFHSAQGLYHAAKAGASGLEHGFLVPVRDWVLLPAFGGVEHVVGTSVAFVQSPEATQLVRTSVDLARSVPILGENVLAPGLVWSVEATQIAWQVVQYPIPSRAAVHNTVDTMMSGTKWFLTTVGTEVYFYAKRVDANITRTLVHTQWQILGSGPYATLDRLQKLSLLDDLSERYLRLTEVTARYELVCHIRSQNQQLYRDLVLSGLLRERGGDSTAQDEWLSREPSYRSLEPVFLLEDGVEDRVEHGDPSSRVVPLYFRLPYVNGERPTKDIRWTRFPEQERQALEERYMDALRNDDSIEPPRNDETSPLSDSTESPYSTIAKWYTPGAEDVLVEEKRHAVSFRPVCLCCRQLLEWRPPMKKKVLGDLCQACMFPTTEEPSVQQSVFCLPPPVSIVMRPTLWRFYGPGDQAVRAVWFLDTKRGLQPYGEESAAALEDAYMFLRWQLGNKKSMKDGDVDGTLLTVQVTGPDESEQQLVQFSSLDRATAIQKTLGGAFSLFKRRVFRGVRQLQRPEPSLRSSLSEHQDEMEAVPDAWEPLQPPSSSTRTTKEPKEQKARLCCHETLEEDEEDDTMAEQPADHLVLMIHGIGEMLRSIDVFGLAIPNLASIVDCSGYLRENHNKVKIGQPSLSSLSGHVEYLPVEWHEAFAIQSRRRSEDPNQPFTSPTVNDISLRTVPQMRDFANDTLMDVLYFMSPQHHDIIIDIVVKEMNVVVDKYRQITGFDGKVSVIGHSLGSIILWDILANPKLSAWVPTEANSPESYSPPPSVSFSRGDTVPMSRESGCSSDSTRSSSVSLLTIETNHTPEEGGDAVEEMIPKFEIENAFFLGSPVAVFLMIRNQQRPLDPDYSLPGCARVFNIFHPYDPVAYRIEPLLNTENSNIQPRIIPHWNGGYRVQYQTKRLWKRIVDETVKTEHTVAQVFEQHMSRIGLLDADGNQNGGGAPSPPFPSIVCGNLNQGHRIDYMLQEKEIELSTEYISALAAHSCYWVEKDLSLFIARQIVRSTLEPHISEPLSPWQATNGLAGYSPLVLYNDSKKK